MKYFVSRQLYWPSGDQVVEVVAGGIEHANPDMLVERFKNLGEGTEFQDAEEAVVAAMAIRDAWNKMLPDGEGCRVEVGYTHGFTMPFENNPTDKELLHWASVEASLAEFDEDEYYEEDWDEEDYMG